MKVTKKQIEEFHSTKKFALVGVSRNPKKFGAAVIKELSPKGFDIIPVNPKADSIMDKKCYANISSLPDDVDRVVIITKKKLTEGIVKEAISKGIKQIWIQQMSETKEAVDLAIESGANVIAKKCIFMFSEPVEGMHKFHKSIYKLFGVLPK